jgi:phasin family protein
MFSITEQLSAATKSQLETQLKLLNTFATTAFEGAQKVIALNLSTTKASVEKSSAAAKQLLEAKDPQEFFSAARAPSFDSALAYGRELFSIASKTQADLLQVTKEQFKEAGAQVKPLVLEAPLLAATAVKAVDIPVLTEDPVETAPAAPKAAAKAEAKAKPATPAKPVAEAVAAPAPKPAAATFPDPKTSVPVKTVAANGSAKQLDLDAPAPAKPKKP